jgi:hypothetical protein
MVCQSQYRIDEFANLVHPRDGHKKIFAMLDAYLDESGIHTDAAVCVIAGYFGGRSQLRKLEIAWKRVLQRFNFPLRDFHAKNLFGKPKHAPMLSALTEAISEQKKVHPISMGIVVDDFNNFSLDRRKWMTGGRVDTNGKWINSGCPSKPYFVPFTVCLSRITDYASVGGKAHFFFGLDRGFAEYALALFKQIKTQLAQGIYLESEWKSKDRLGDADFPMASQTPQLQAADLFVHLTYQRILQHYSSGDWAAAPVSDMLANCVKNTASEDDHGIMNKEHLEKLYQKAEANVRRKTLSQDLNAP